MLEAIVFDFDGVIVDTEPLHLLSFRVVLQPLGVDLDEGSYRELALGVSDRQGLEHICRKFKVPFNDDLLSRLVRHKSDAMQVRAEHGVSPCPGAVELLCAASESMPIALCTGALRRDVDSILPAIPPGDLVGRFQTIITVEDVTQSKPHPECYSLAVERLGLDPAHCLAIEDTPSGVRAARSAGLYTLGVVNTCAAAELHEAHHLTASLAEITLHDLLNLTA